MEITYQYSLIIKSEPKNIELLQPFVKEIVTKNGCDDQKTYDILLVLTEAVNNCIYHGNRKNPSKTVIINGICEHKRLLFHISDEGDGFQLSNVADPTSQENLLEPNGRGIFIMQHLADRMNYLNDGKSLEIIFHL